MVPIIRTMAIFNLRHFNSGTITPGLSVKDLQRMAESGQIDPKDEVRQDGHKTWHLVTNVKGLNIRHKTGECDPPEDPSTDLADLMSQATEALKSEDKPKLKDITNHTGEYCLSEVTGTDASGLLQEIFTLIREQEELESSWRGWFIWPILGVAGLLWGFMILVGMLSEFQDSWHALLMIIPMIPSFITTLLWNSYRRNNYEISRFEREISKKTEERGAKIEMQVPYVDEVFKGWGAPIPIAVEIAAVEVWNFPEGWLLYNEGGVAVYNPEEDRLSLVETNNISNVKYDFDRKHLGSKSGTESNAAAGAVGAILGAVIGGLIFDSDIDYGDAATAGVAGAIVGGSNKRQTVVNEYEEHAVVDIYSTSNKLSHLGVDFVSQQNSAKRFLSYIQNAMPEEGPCV